MSVVTGDTLGSSQQDMWSAKHVVCKAAASAIDTYIHNLEYTEMDT